MDQLGLEDLEVDQRVDLLRTRTRGFNQRPQHYTLNKSDNFAMHFIHTLGSPGSKSQTSWARKSITLLLRICNLHPCFKIYFLNDVKMIQQM